MCNILSRVHKHTHTHTHTHTHSHTYAHAHTAHRRDGRQRGRHGQHGRHSGRVSARHKFSQVLPIVPFFSKSAKALTFENVCQALGAGQSRPRAGLLMCPCPRGVTQRAKCPREAGRACPRHHFSKVLCIVRLYRKCTRALTFQNVGAGRMAAYAPGGLARD